MLRFLKEKKRTEELTSVQERSDEIDSCQRVLRLVAMLQSCLCNPHSEFQDATEG